MGQLGDLHMTVKVTVVNPASDETSAFGHGVAQLCRGVRETGSLYAAAKRMGMAYSKAWRVLRDTETALGITLLDRDGARGSTLTDEGNRLLDAYYEIAAQLGADAERLFAERFGADRAGQP